MIILCHLEYASASLISRFRFLVEWLFWINFLQMYFQFSKLTLILLFSAHVSIFSKTLCYLPVLTAAGIASNLTSSVNCIIMLVFQFKIIYVNFKKDSTLNRAFWHPCCQLTQLNMLLFIIIFFVLFVPVFSPCDGAQIRANCNSFEKQDFVRRCIEYSTKTQMISSFLSQLLL